MCELAMAKERELGLTGPVKVLMMLVIVLYHACASGLCSTNPPRRAPLLGTFVQWLSTIHVPLFLLVSGYIDNVAKSGVGSSALNLRSPESRPSSPIRQVRR